MKKTWRVRLCESLRGNGKYRAAVMGAVMVLCVLAVALGTRAGTVATAGTVRDLPIYSVKRDDKVISISFDAAWGDEQTQPLIDILARYGIKTTFFVVGEWVEKYPHQVKALADAGHEVMNHSESHPYMTKLSASEQVRELEACNDRIEAITGVRPTLFRAPYGDYNNTVVGTARSCGLFTIQWDVDSLDWKDLTPSQMYERIVPKVQPGSIVLFHNGGKYTPDALPMILEALLRDGYKIVPISELIYTENYTVDLNGRQIPRATLSE